MNQVLSLLLLWFFTSPCLSQVTQNAVTGRWVTIDDESGKPRSVVEISERNGKLTGRILQLFRGPDEDQDPVCDKCPGEKQGKRIIGMTFFDDVVRDDDEWEGHMLDPESGKVYSCKIWPEDGKLKVRGYLLFFYRTQEWRRE